MNKKVFGADHSLPETDDQTYPEDKFIENFKKWK